MKHNNPLALSYYTPSIGPIKPDKSFVIEANIF